MARRSPGGRDAAEEYAAIVAARPHPKNPRGRRVPPEELREAVAQYVELNYRAGETNRRR
jgi:hypothetical protein